MSRILEIQDNLQDTAAAIARLERAVREDPQSRSLLAMIRSLEKRQQEQEADFLLEADSLGVDVCSYRLFAEQGRPTIAGLSKALGDFQNLVSVVYDTVKSARPKERARVSSEIMHETAFTFGYAFSGSLGVVLTLPNQRLLVGESHLDEAIRVVFSMARVSNPEEILDFARRLGPGPVRAMYQWALDHAKAGLGADIEWRRNREIRANLLIQRPELDNLHRVIGRTSDETTEEMTVEGQLVGADVKRRSFHLQVEGQPDISGSFTDAISESQTVELPRPYRVTLTKTVRICYSTEQEDTSYRVIRLEALP